MMYCQSFPPLAAPTARVLILGSMPGVASLRHQQYYAHPRNAFWPIMGALFDAGLDHDYATRCARLIAHGIAVWDVLRQCERPGSLDAAILPESMVINDFPGFFASHRYIERVYFNGGTAERLFRQWASPQLALHSAKTFCCKRLPSTSPAHASLSLDEKIAAWRVISGDTP